MGRLIHIRDEIGKEYELTDFVEEENYGDFVFFRGGQEKSIKL